MVMESELWFGVAGVIKGVLSVTGAEMD